MPKASAIFSSVASVGLELFSLYTAPLASPAFCSSSTIVMPFFLASLLIVSSKSSAPFLKYYVFRHVILIDIVRKIFYTHKCTLISTGILYFTYCIQLTLYIIRTIFNMSTLFACFFQLFLGRTYYGKVWTNQGTLQTEETDCYRCGKRTGVC